MFIPKLACICVSLNKLFNTTLALASLLARPERIDKIIYDELLDIQKRYGDDRRTEIGASAV